MGNYTAATLKTSIKNMVSADFSDAVFLEVSNRAVREVCSRVDLRSSIRRTSLVPNMLLEQYEYQCPSDLKINSVIDIQPKTGRKLTSSWRLTTMEEFDRTKAEMITDDSLGLISLGDSNQIRKILISNIYSDDQTLIDDMETSANWTKYGDTDTVGESTNRVVGDESLSYNIDATGGTTAGVYNDDISVDLTNYRNDGQIYVWAYLSSETDVTNFKIRIGTAAAYYEITVTTNNEGTAFQEGWNLLRFDLEDKTETGTVAYAACTYALLFMTKDSGKVSETGYLFNYLTVGVGSFYDVVYYSKYLWKTSGSVRIENSTTTTDILIADTDEIRLIESRTAMLMETYLKNHSESQLWEKKYGEIENGYQMANTSQALIMTTIYADYGNL